MQIEDRGLIYDANARPKDERVASFTSLCPSSSGSILCGFHLGSAKHAPNSTIRLCRSRDRGKTWTEVAHRFATDFNGVRGSIAGSEMAEVKPGRLMICTTWFDRSDPARPFFDPVTEGVIPSKLLSAFSEDDGETWGPWRELPKRELKGCAGCGPVLRWADGTIGYPFESYKEAGDPAPGSHAAWLILSRDGGRTFGEPRLVAKDPRARIYYWDERLAAGPKPGEFVGLFWTHDLKEKKDLDVHFCRTEAAGGGFRAGPVRATGIPGQIAAPLWLEDGRLLAFVVDRGRPGTMTLCSSADGGATWPVRLVVYTHDERAALTQGADNVDFAQYWEDMAKWSFGHPAIRPLGDGRVLLAFYAGPPGSLSIHWARVSLVP